MLSDKQITRELNPDFSQQVYQDPITEGLFTVKRIERDRVVVGGGCGFYDSAITSLMRYAIPNDYFDRFIPITTDSKMLEVDIAIASGYYQPLKVKGWDCISNNHIQCAVYESDDIQYLSETDELVKANMKKWGYDDDPDWFGEDMEV